MTKPTPAQVVVDSLAALEFTADTVRRLEAGRWQFAANALTAGASLERTADAMGLTPAVLRAGLESWAMWRRELGLIDGQRYAELLRLASGEGGAR